MDRWSACHGDETLFCEHQGCSKPKARAKKMNEARLGWEGWVLELGGKMGGESRDNGANTLLTWVAVLIWGHWTGQGAGPTLVNEF